MKCHVCGKEFLATAHRKSLCSKKCVENYLRGLYFGRKPATDATKQKNGKKYREGKLPNWMYR